MELRPLPPSLGFGFYISDSDESVDSAVRDWLAQGCPEDFPENLKPTTDASTVYQSAKESSIDNVSYASWDTLSMLDGPIKRTRFPDPAMTKDHFRRLIKQQEDSAKEIFNTRAMYDSKLRELEEKRKRCILQIEHDFVTTLTSLKMTKHEQKTEVLTAPRQQIRNTTQLREPTHPVGNAQPSESTQQTRASAQPSTSSAAVQQEPTPVKTEQPSPPLVKTEEPTPAVKIENPSPPSVKIEQPVASPVKPEQEEAPLPPQEATKPASLVNTKQEAELYPAPSLVAMSEQMRVPHSHPPPETLFSLDAEEPRVDPAEIKIAFHASRNAVEFEEYHKRNAQELISMMGDYGTNITNRSICKMIDKQMKIDVQQISAVEQQVRAKTSRILSTLKKLEGSVGLIYGYAQFGRYLINRCAGISDNVVFAVARVTVNIIEHHPKLLSLLLSFLHEVSVLTVPKFYSTTSSSLRGTLLDKLGFRDVSGIEHDRKETNDEFINRQSGYVKFYAALIELDGKVHGLQFGWSYLSRMLNNLPPSRITASALMAFLKIAGYSLFKTYRRQFFKVLLYVHSTFLVKLANDEDDEAKAVYMRLQSYLQGQDFMKPPQFKALKLEAESRAIHA